MLRLFKWLKSLLIKEKAQVRKEIKIKKEETSAIRDEAAYHEEKIPVFDKQTGKIIRYNTILRKK